MERTRHRRCETSSAQGDEEGPSRNETRQDPQGLRQPPRLVGFFDLFASAYIERNTVSAEMRLQPNIGSDRSWVWKVAADYTEEPPTAETLAIRFANSDNANEFKRQFELTQKMNSGASLDEKSAHQAEEEEEEEYEEAKEGEGEEEKKEESPEEKKE